MNKNFKKTSLTEKVINKVKSGQVKMKPKMYFVLKTVLFSLITLFTALFALFLMSFIIFVLKANGVWFLPSFGLKTIGMFFTSLPWILILIAIILIIVLELLVKNFSFAYRRPIFYSVLVIIIFIALGSFTIGRIQIHDNLFLKAQEDKLSIAGKFYREFSKSKSSQMHKGVILDVIDNGFYLKTFDGEILTVITDSNTKLPLDKSISKDDKIIILGERSDDNVKAVDIRTVNYRNSKFNILEMK